MGGPNKYPYYLHEKLSAEFHSLLLTEPVFKSEPKAVMAAFKWCNNLLRGQQRNENKPVTFHSEDIKDQFGTYSKTTYTTFVDALISLKLVRAAGLYQRAIRIGKFFRPGRCNKFSLTPTGKALVTSSNLGYFKSLSQDREVRRKCQKRASDNRANHLPYGDAFLDHQRELLLDLSFDIPSLNQVLQKNPDCNDDVNLLIELANKSLPRLHRNVADGRVWNPVVALASELRPFLKHRGMSYVATVDQRACHPTFFGSYLLSLVRASLQAGGSTALKQAPQSIHFFGDLSDIERDCDRWLAFTTQEEDFRKKIGRECGWPVGRVKNRLNRWLNGWKTEKLDEWLSRSFPALGGVWEKLDKPTRKRTGCQISSGYETKLFQDPELYRLADSLGLKLSYEYDGVGVFASTVEVDSELKKLTGHITATGHRLFGFNVRLTVDRIKPTKLNWQT